MGGAAFGPVTLAGLTIATGEPVTAVMQYYAIPMFCLLLFTLRYGGRPDPPSATMILYERIAQGDGGE